MNPSDGSVNLRGGHLLTLNALVIEELARRGADVSIRRLVEARSNLEPRSIEDLEELAQRLGEAMGGKSTERDDENAG